jgi:hypothetical protein
MVLLIEYVVFVNGALIEVSGNSDASARAVLWRFEDGVRVGLRNAGFRSAF